MEDQQPPVPVPAASAEDAGLAQVRYRIAAIDQAASEYLREQRPANTQRSYAGDWRLWCHYCAQVGIASRDVSPGTLVGLVLWLEQGQHRHDRAPAAPATIRRRVYGTLAALRADGVAVPDGVAGQAHEAIAAYERRLAATGEQRGRGKAPVVTVHQLRAICAELPDTLAGHRDRALLLLGFALAARRDELAHLSVGDIQTEPQGLVVAIRYSKTAARTVAIPHGRRSATCPVTAWHTWAAEAGLHSGRAFRSIDRHGNPGDSLTAHGIGAAITRSGETAGLLTRITAHSLRAGLATEARRAGHDPHAIATQGGWAGNSAALHGYLRTVDQWGDNALVRIGL